MIRIHLTPEDIENVRVSDTPAFGTELNFAVYLLSSRTGARHLLPWRDAVSRKRLARSAPLFSLCTPTTTPDFVSRAVHPDRSATVARIAATDPMLATEYLQAHLRSSPPPIARALADGDPAAYSALGHAVADFQAAALDPYRAQISAAVASAAAAMTVRMGRLGVGGLLRTMHPSLRWDGRTLSVGTDYEGDVELAGRSLVLKPMVLTTGPVVGEGDGGTLVVHLPTVRPLTPHPRPAPVPQALGALVGPMRAAALAAIVRQPSLTTGQLAESLDLSAATASRHAAVLRTAGLITTHRAGMTVHHLPTPLGYALVNEPVDDFEAA